MNKQTIHTIIQLMENNEVVHTIDIEEIDDYKFHFDTKNLSTISVFVSKLKMKDLHALVSKVYDHYVVIGTKTMLNDTRSFAIPAKIFKNFILVDNGDQISLTFNEEENG